MDDSPELVPEQTPINVLVVGETQQGKSTLIKRMSQYAGLPDPEIAIGEGHLACTKTVKEYSVVATPLSYNLVREDQMPVTDLSYEELCELDNDEAHVVEVREEGTIPVTFNFIDTPGLNDADQDDMMHMAHIVGRCSEISHLNALIYVRSVEKPYGQSFQQFFTYLQRCLPTFSKGFIIVHTSFSTRRVQEYASRQIDLAAVRRDAFLKTTNLDLEHFFMENKPLKRSPFALQQSLHETGRLLRHLQSQKPVRSADFRLLKTDHMQNVDDLVKNSVNKLKFKLEKDRQKDESVGLAFQNSAIFHQTEISRLRSRISTVDLQIQSLTRGPDVILGTKSHVEDYGWGTLFQKAQLRLSDVKLDYVAEHEITSVTKSKSGGSRWRNEQIRGKTWSATLSGSSFRGLDGSVTFYTTSAIRYRESIEVFHTLLRELEEGIVAHKDAIRRSGAGEMYSESAAEIGRNLGSLDNLLDILGSEDFDMALWPKLRVFYVSNGRLTKQQICEFVRIFDAETAKLLSLE